MKEVVSTIWELQDRMTAKRDAWLEEAEACVRKLEANREKSEAVVQYQEVPNEKAAVENIGALEDWSWDWHLAVSCCRWLTHRAVPFLHKGCSHKGPTIKRHQAQPKCNNGIRDHSLK
jgi:hypothetical protein